MKISVFGLGYVGCVSAACLAHEGHQVVGVDVNPEKVAMVAAGRTPVLEERIDALIAETVAAGSLRATTDAGEAVQATEIALVCVGTPSGSHGRLSTAALERAAEQIGAALAGRKGRFTVVFRSTMLPGTCEEVLQPILTRGAGREPGTELGLAVNPEFLREGSGVADFFEPPKLVVGGVDERSAREVLALYDGLDCPVFSVPIRVAELAKYVDNAFHGLKVGFANEIGALARELGVDSHRVMEIFRSDTKLNISSAYLTPGFAFGGSCLPKDLRALAGHARGLGLSLPIIEHVLASNDEHLRRTLELVVDSGRRRVGLFGLAFKQGTDDLRESPLVELGERLLGKGYELKIYDPYVSLSQLTGANRAYIETHLPHLADLLADSADEVLAHAEVCVVGSKEQAVVEAIARADGRLVIDLVRLPDADVLRGQAEYVGVAW
ncbi:MAG TPA: nucleotide sugar dehydrogenase [Gaiellaceae bacterium]